MEWQDLADKLRRMGVRLNAPKTMQPKQKHPVENVIDGEFLQTNYGRIFTAGVRYDLKDYRHGSQKLVTASIPNRLAQWAKIELPDPFKLENIIFLDTETTGLSGGTGTVAFMVGLARVEGDQLVLKQFFLRNPAEEQALLAGLGNFCDGMQAIVSYNGKSFDIPILNTRFILNGFTSPFTGLPHYDLLHLVRRLWKARLSQCNLSNIEKNILGLTRKSEDIPGYLVPEIYSDYLLNGNAIPLKDVFYHNQEDVVSLAALFAFLTDLMENPTCADDRNMRDILSIGKLFEHMGENDLASELYEQSANRLEELEDVTEPYMRKGLLAKRKKDYRTALLAWQDAAVLGSIEAIIELAKYQEHVEKRADIALRYAEDALAACVELGVSTQQLKELENRKTRLLKKISRP